MEKVQPTNAGTQKKVSLLGLRANSPRVFRALALFALLATVLAIGIGFWQSRNNRDFRMKGLPPQLSKDVVGTVEGYERRETDAGVLKYYIKADRATTFSDNHQELENVYLEVYDEAGERFDKIAAAAAIYIPDKESSKLFDVFLSGNVRIETRDALFVNTEKASYNRASEIAESEELVEFTRRNVSGKSVGVIVKVREKQLELLSGVEINAVEPDEFGGASVKQARVNAGRAVVFHDDRIEAERDVVIDLTPKNNGGGFNQPAEIRAARAVATLNDGRIKRFDLTQNVEVFVKPTAAKPDSTKTSSNAAVAFFDGELKRVEFNENVEIETARGGDEPTVIRAGNAIYEKTIDRFDLKNGVEITTVAGNQPTFIRAAEAVYEQPQRKIHLAGGAEITQNDGLIKGDAMTAELYPNRKLQNAFVRGNAFLKQTTPDRSTEVSANELNAFFGENQQINKARAVGGANVSIVPAQAQEYSKATVFAPNALDLLFRAAGGKSVLSQIQTEGRTSVVMNAVAGSPKSSTRKLTADAMKTVLSESGKDILKAEAVGNAELYVEPTASAPENHKTTLTAPRFDCEFFEIGNNPKTCRAVGGGKAVLTPTVAGANRGARTLSAENLIAVFNRQTQEVERFDAAGAAKFNELDRHGTANQMTFTAGDETIRLRGEPLVWDSRARAKAGEIDWDARNQKSFLRGKVSTTYYSQRQTGGAVPFGNSGAPVFVTAEQAEFDQRSDTGVYAGNARAWQENNYVRADKLTIQPKARRFDGEGKVQSLLYNAPRAGGAKGESQPVFAAADRMFYADENRQLHYEGNVDVRQGADRIAAGVADVYLTDANDLKQTVLQNNVRITQPNRRFSGTWAQYTVADETVVLRGSPAIVEDSERGGTQGSQLTVSLRENRVTGEGAANPNRPGRTRTVYKVKNP